MVTAQRPSFTLRVSLGASLRINAIVAALALGSFALSPATNDRDSGEIDDAYVHNGGLCYFPEDEDDERRCQESPLPLGAAGPGGVALYDRPTTSTRITAEIAPGESINAIATRFIRYFAHRGMVRRAGGGLSVGDTVYPAAWNELDAYPFHDWNEPIYDLEPDHTYLVQGNAARVEVRSNSADVPLIDWRQVRPREQFDRWYRLVRADGTRS